MVPALAELIPSASTRLSPRAMAAPFSKLSIFSDFDGTISNQDSLKLLLQRFGPKTWPELSAALSEGRTSEREALGLAFEGFEMSEEFARAFVLKHISIDPHFHGFSRWAAESGFELSILSGGFKKFIDWLMKREGLDLPVLANNFEAQGDGWQVSECAQKRLCELCTHCKSFSLMEAREQKPKTFVVYIGDGHTDYCPVQLAHLVFAKGSLAAYCERQRIPFIRFDDFSDVEAALADRLRNDSRLRGLSWSASSTMRRHS